MAAKASKNVGAILADGTSVDAALAQGVREALRRHCQAGQPAAEWQNGKTVWVTPSQIRRRLAGIVKQKKP